MQTRDEIVQYLESLAPLGLAEEYDNVGLLIDGGQTEVSRVLISLDTDEAVATEAATIGAELVLSHHPLLFHPLKRIVAGEHTGRTVRKLLQNDISLYAMHTNFDSVSGGLCDHFLKKIFDVRALDCLEGEYPNGVGRMAVLAESVKLSEVLEKIKKEFSLPSLRYVGEEGKEIKTIALCNGGGAEFTETSFMRGADLYISGDFKYHQIRFAYENQMALVEIPHYEAEIDFCRLMKQHLDEKFGDSLDCVISHANPNPCKIC